MEVIAIIAAIISLVIGGITLIDKLTNTHKQRIDRLEKDVKDLEDENKDLTTLIAQQSSQISVLTSILTRVEKALEKINDKLE